MDVFTLAGKVLDALDAEHVPYLVVGAAFTPLQSPHISARENVSDRWTLNPNSEVGRVAQATRLCRRATGPTEGRGR